jgi:hypothetical protein
MSVDISQSPMPAGLDRSLKPSRGTMEARFAISPMRCLAGQIARGDPVLEQAYTELFAVSAVLEPVYL